MKPKIILNSREVSILLERLACELIEKHKDFSNTVIVGIQPRGVVLMKKIVEILRTKYQYNNLKTGILDITFFRDDFRRRETPIEANTTSINVVLEKKRVVLIDDVLYTGRSIRAALSAIDNYGRPDDIELLVLIDRRFSRNLPIQPTYKGKQVDSFNTEEVKVKWTEHGKNDQVLLQIKKLNFSK